MSDHYPSFLCIGAQKAGTTWLDKQLRAHCDLWLPPMKEVHYFDYVDRPEFRKWITWHLRITLRRELFNRINSIDKQRKAVDWKELEYLSKIMTYSDRFTDNWYKHLFSIAPSGSITGEITPEYSTISDKGINHILKLCPNIKVIYIIRDPVKRASSQLKMNMVRNGDFRKAVNPKTKEVVNLNLFYKNLEHYSIKDRGNYSTYVPRWDDKLKDNMLYIPFQQIAKNPKDVLHKVFTHIGVEMEGYSGAPEKVVHKGGDFKMPREIVSILEKDMQPQYEFLESRFEAEFYNKI